MFKIIAAGDIPVIIAYHKLSDTDKRSVEIITEDINKAIETGNSKIELKTHEELLTYVYDNSDPFLGSSFDHVLRNIEDPAKPLVHYPKYESLGDMTSASVINFLTLCGYEVNEQKLMSSNCKQCPDYYFLWPGIRALYNPLIRKLARTQILTIGWPTE